MRHLQSVRIQRFKRIHDAPFDLAELNVLVGANNSGKSSLIQGLHFAISLLQSVRLGGTWPKNPGKTVATTLSPNQLIYSPSEDAYALANGGRLLSEKTKAIQFSFVLESGSKFEIQVSKGKNKNIAVVVTEPKTADALTSLEQPFTIFSPGLAGISKTEAFVSDGVLYRALARGDANLVLRNILHRLWGTQQWASFQNDLREIFPSVDLEIRFAQNIDEHIQAIVRTHQGEVPLELAGTGVLQAAQILSYIHKFSPKVVVLDEPDSHLHPNNQRLICSLLREIALTRGVQVILTTHSRHVVDVVGSDAKFIWVQNGNVEAASADDQLAILMDIGALDVKERVAGNKYKCIVLTEDDNTKPIETLLEANGGNLEDILILPYYGVTKIQQLRPLIEVIRGVNKDVKLVLHRDHDAMTEEDVDRWCKNVRALSVEPFVTESLDIEGHFVCSKHLSELNKSFSEKEFDELISGIFNDHKPEFIAAHINRTIENERRMDRYSSVNVGEIGAYAEAKILECPKSRVYGKLFLRRISQRFQESQKRNLVIYRSTKNLKVDALTVILAKVFSSRKS